MDLGIKGKTALVCAASKGLGKGCAMSLAREGVNVVITARGKDALEATAEEIRKATGAKVIAVAGDITTPEGRAQALEACPQPDILVNNAGGPPPGDFRNWSRDDWIKALDGNMLTPIELIKSVIDGMIERRFGRIVNITSGAVKMPIPELGMSNGARTGLTGFVAGLSRSVAQAQRHHQQPASGAVRHRPAALEHGVQCQEGRQDAGRARQVAHGGESRQSFRHRGRVRRRLRLPLQRACGLHRRPEPAARRRRFPRNILER